MATDRHCFLVARDKGIISTAINVATTVVTSLFIVLLCIRLFLSLLIFLVFAGYGSKVGINHRDGQPIACPHPRCDVSLNSTKHLQNHAEVVHKTPT